LNQAYVSNAKIFRNIYILALQDMSGTEAAKNKAAYTKEGRRQLFSLLQGARGSTGKFFLYVAIPLSTLVWYLWKWKLWFYRTDSAYNQAIYAMLI
jgi:hypothetical protein